MKKHVIIRIGKILWDMLPDGKSGIPVDFNLVCEKGQKADKPFGMSNLNYSFLSFSKCQWVSNHWKEVRNISKFIQS